MRYAYSLIEWAKELRNQAVWDKIVKEYDLVQSPFISEATLERVFSFADGAILQTWPIALRYVVHLVKLRLVSWRVTDQRDWQYGPKP